MEPYSRRVTQDERRHGKSMSRSGEEKKRESAEKHEESERREVAIYASGSSSSEGTTFYGKCTIFSKHMVKRSKIQAQDTSTNMQLLREEDITENAYGNPVCRCDIEIQYVNNIENHFTNIRIVNKYLQ
ncbi:hypothetical protein G5I_10031 [Acromyrmex echinatior]|uniref:Uncharacterized protein n=1 Tax=Acromyrmex echinatior TaxID=103372 RepID=F4WVS9_ACREC|nr:hypothetical protein G5I_10031 [Acromyrmex echinatior]